MEVQAVVNKDLSKRIRAVTDKFGAEQVLEKDLQMAVDIVKFQVTVCTNSLYVSCF